MNRFFILFFILLTNCHRPNELKSLDYDHFGIRGGGRAEINEFPWVVNIWLNDPADQYYSQHCGGTLIAPRWVLTAAHCVIEDKSESVQGIISIEKLEVYLGGILASGADAKKSQVKKVYVHPEVSWPHADFALIELLKSEDLNNLVQIGSTSESERAQVTAVGWGVEDQEGLRSPKQLKKVMMNLLPTIDCENDAFIKYIGWEIDGSMICTNTNENSMASCSGDSGGPLVHMNQKNKWELIGVVSWGSACRGHNSKYPKASADVYGRVSYALPWIKSLVDFQK